MGFPNSDRVIFSTSLVALVLFVLLSRGDVEAKVTKARAVIYRAVPLNSPEPLVSLGELEFVEEQSGQIHVSGTVNGIQPAGQPHGFHIHELGSLKNNCMAAGPHFNPQHKLHGSPSDSAEGRHVGDLGNIDVDQSGMARVDITDSLISLNGPNSIVGRAVVVHEKADDMGKGGNDESKKTGNAGKRLGCGIIGITAEDESAYNGATTWILGNTAAPLILLLPLLLLLAVSGIMG